ncbi:transposase [Cucumis melo var. makuwa]|uniref:Transposase n=1 Tax=Cucumis melo var. makuwa TaxID=1194695 RepID=A0A5A7TM34_CUCMM|nr:transposase [Cucumis melo var. makuwa]
MNSGYKLNTIDHSVHGYKIRKVVSNTIRWLAHGLNCGVMTYKGYMVNGFSYHTKSRDDHRTVQNSGIMLVAMTMQVSSGKDKNPVIGDMSFYGIIEDIWEVSYNTFNTVLFKCKWVENKTGVRTDDLHFTLVDLSRIGHSSDSFIIATHGKQVFYVSNPVDPRWSVVVMSPQKDFPYKCANDDLGNMLSHYPQSQNGIKQVTLMKVVIHTLDLTVKAHGLPLDFHRTKPVEDTNPTVLKQTYFIIVDMVDSQDIATRKEKGESSTQKRKRGPTEIKEITRARSRICGRPSIKEDYHPEHQQHWTEFVASRLKEDFKKKSENGKEKRKKHKYNHRTSKNGYANLMEELKASSSNQIDRSIVWKQAKMDRNGQISDEETKEVVNLIDEFVATQNTTNAFGEEDILIRALGGKDCQGILHGVGKYVTKKKYFHTATQQKTNEKEDEKVISKEHDRMAKRIKVMEEELLKMKEKDDCVGDLKEESGMGSKEKSSMDGAENVKDLNEDVKDDEEVEGVTLDKMKIDYGEFTKDMSTFAPTPIQNAPVALWYLYTRMKSSRTLNLYKFVDAGSISYGSSKQERAQLLTARLLGTDYDQLLLIPYNSENHWILVVINLTKGVAFWIDPLKNRIDPDVTEVVERSFNIMNKKKPNWRVVKCPKQSGLVECGYYVMRFMRDIIMSASTSIIQIMKDSPRTYTQDDIDCIRFEWAEFVGKHVHCA